MVKVDTLVLFPDLRGDAFSFSQLRIMFVVSLSYMAFTMLEKEMATHSIILAWRIPGMEEPGGLLFMGSHRVGHD